MRLFSNRTPGKQPGQIFRERHDELAAFLGSSGVGVDHAGSLTVYLVGAGTSDYIGRSLTHLIRKQWHCEVQAVPSTDLLTNFNDFVLAQRRYQLISFSRSGDSPEGVAVLLLACLSEKGDVAYR